MILPQFKIENLPSGSEFKVNVFARNEKGISDKTEVLRPDDDFGFIVFIVILSI